MAQSVRCFLCKHEDLGSTSRTQEKKPGVVAHTCNLSAEEAEIAGSWGTQAKQHRLIYEFQAKWQTLSQKVRWGRGPKKHVRSLHTYEHMYTHPHKRTQKHPPWMKVRGGTMSQAGTGNKERAKLLKIQEKLSSWSLQIPRHQGEIQPNPVRSICVTGRCSSYLKITFLHRNVNNWLEETKLKGTYATTSLFFF